MSNVEALESAIKALQPKELAEFRRWFNEFDFAGWDQKIEVDVASGKLDALLAEAEADVAQGEPRSL